MCVWSRFECEGGDCPVYQTWAGVWIAHWWWAAWDIEGQQEVGVCVSFPLFVNVNNQKQLKSGKKSIVWCSLPPPILFSTSLFYHGVTCFCSRFTLFLAHFPICPCQCWPTALCLNLCSEIFTHRISQPVPPGLPLQAVFAVVEAVSSGEFIPRVPGISSLSRHHCQESQSAQINLDSTSTAFKSRDSSIIPKTMWSLLRYYILP